MKEQLELFPAINDNRIQKLTEYLKVQIDFNPFWYPSAKQILEIGERFSVEGSKPLDIIDEIWQKRYGKANKSEYKLS
jgi:hypothetical protein